MRMSKARVVEFRQATRYNRRMTKPLKLIPIGNSTGAIFPKEMLRDLGVEQGDNLYPVHTPNGIELRNADPEFIEEMELAREIMRRRRNVLRELAK